MAKLHMLKSVTDTINTSLIFQENDSLIIFDGGHDTEAEYLYSYLKDLGGKVDGWFFTHVHEDHIWAVCELLDKHGDEIQVNKFYYNFPSDEFLKVYEPKQTHMTTMELVTLFRQTIEKNEIDVITVQKNEVFSFNDIKVTVLRVPDEKLTMNPINNSSVCYRVEAAGKSVMILGDLGIEGGRQLLEINDPALIHSDYVQMAHHGQDGVERKVYEAIRPDYCLWCTPSWLWDNIGPEGYDTNVFHTLITRGWISEMKVKKHYVMKDGTHVIDLSCFDVA